MKQIKLTRRLKTIADYIKYGACVTDIGTDHGHLPVYLAQTGSVSRIIASDISAASLNAARRSADKYDVTDKITFISAPGLDAVSPSDTDTIVITGLGGETILDILKAAPWTKHDRIELILQPQSKIELLCRFLYDNGYKIKETKSITDMEKTYTIILCTGYDQ